MNILWTSLGWHSLIFFAGIFLVILKLILGRSQYQTGAEWISIAFFAIASTGLAWLFSLSWLNTFAIWGWVTQTLVFCMLIYVGWCKPCQKTV